MYCRPTPLHSTFNYKATSVRKPLPQTLVMDFFGDQKRVASRRHRPTPSKPQCTKRSSPDFSWSQPGSGADWQTLKLQSDISEKADRLSGDSTNMHTIYTSGYCWFNQDLLLSVLFLLSACIVCSFSGRQRKSNLRT